MNNEDEQENLTIGNRMQPSTVPKEVVDFEEHSPLNAVPLLHSPRALASPPLYLPFSRKDRGEEHLSSRKAHFILRYVASEKR